MARRTNRPRWQPERLHAETQRGRPVAEQQLGETEKRLESGQPIRVPSPKLFSFRGLKRRGFSFPG